MSDQLFLRHPIWRSNWYLFGDSMTDRQMAMITRMFAVTIQALTTSRDDEVAIEDIVETLERAADVLDYDENTRSLWAPSTKQPRPKPPFPD